MILRIECNTTITPIDIINCIENKNINTLYYEAKKKIELDELLSEWSDMYAAQSIPYKLERK